MKVVEVYALFVIGYTTFFLMYLNETVSDMLPSKLPWYGIYTYWSAEVKLLSWTKWRCSASTVFSFLVISSQLIAPKVVQTHATTILKGASVFLAFAALCAIYAAMTIESYAFLRYYNAFLGMASSVTMCFGVPVVFTMAMKKQPSTRAVVLGSLAISMLLGELTGFFLVWVCSFESATVISGILCLLGAAFLLTLPSFPCEQTWASNTPSIIARQYKCGAFLLTHFTKNFLKRLALSSLLFVSIELPRTLWTLSFNEMFAQLTGNFEGAGIYCLVATAFSIACCLVSVTYNHLSRSSYTQLQDVFVHVAAKYDVTTRKYRMTFYVFFSFALNASFLLCVTNNYQLAEFASIAVTGYYISSALYRESLLELMPVLFEEGAFKQQWPITVLLWQGSKILVREGVKYRHTGIRALPARSRLTVFFAICTASHLVALLLIQFVARTSDDGDSPAGMALQEVNVAQAVRDRRRRTVDEHTQTEAEMLGAATRPFRKHRLRAATRRIGTSTSRRVQARLRAATAQYLFLRDL